MRGMLLAVVVAAGLGLGGTATVSAAPASGSTILNAADAATPITQVQHWRWGSGGGWGHGPRRSHWRWGSGGGGWGFRGCVRCGPYGRCWRVC